MEAGVWQAGLDVYRLVSWLFFEQLVSDRKLRLFSVACSRPIVIHLGCFADAAAGLLLLTEAFADGKLPARDLNDPREALLDRWGEYEQQCTFGTGNPTVELSDNNLELFAVAQSGILAVTGTTRCADERDQRDSQYRRRSFYHSRFARPFPLVVVAEALSSLVEAGNWKDGVRNNAIEYQRHLVHDIFGNPFHPTTFDPTWRTEHTVGIATKMYDERNFDAMPILADALQDAGCDSEDILKHCREPGVHVRGCWVVDLVLGKE
jgi:hypothetical protein